MNAKAHKEAIRKAMAAASADKSVSPEEYADLMEEIASDAQDCADAAREDIACANKEGAEE